MKKGVEQSRMNEKKRRERKSSGKKRGKECERKRRSRGAERRRASRESGKTKRPGEKRTDEKMEQRRRASAQRRIQENVGKKPDRGTGGREKGKQKKDDWRTARLAMGARELGRASARYKDIPLLNATEWARQTLEKGIDGLREEYGRMRKENRRNLTVLVSKENMERNRYHDVGCWDQTRVRLRGTDNDYIHASYIDGYWKENEFICAQGPLASTIEDFWEMVWQENSRVIVMLTPLEEKRKVKCAPYWSTTEATISIGPFKVTTWKHEMLSLLKQRVTCTPISVRKGGESREMHHYLYLSWPDKRSPSEGYPLCKLLEEVRRRNKSDEESEFGPVIVHCSAGIGRSGTLVAVDICLQRFFATNQVDVEAVVREIRAQRMHAVQTDEQYVFIHRVVLEFLTKLHRIPHLKIKAFMDDFDERYSRDP